MKNSDESKNDPKWVKMAAEVQDCRKLMRLWKTSLSLLLFCKSLRVCVLADK